MTPEGKPTVNAPHAAVIAWSMAAADKRRAEQDVLHSDSMVRAAEYELDQAIKSQEQANSRFTAINLTLATLEHAFPGLRALQGIDPRVQVTGTPEDPEEAGDGV